MSGRRAAGGARQGSPDAPSKEHCRNGTRARGSRGALKRFARSTAGAACLSLQAGQRGIRGALMRKRNCRSGRLEQEGKRGLLCAGGQRSIVGAALRLEIEAQAALLAWRGSASRRGGGGSPTCPPACLGGCEARRGSLRFAGASVLQWLTYLSTRPPLIDAALVRPPAAVNLECAEAGSPHGFKSIHPSSLGRG